MFGLSVVVFFFFGFSQRVYSGRPGNREALHLKEGVGPPGGEAWLVLAPKDPVGQREVDLGSCGTALLLATGNCWPQSPPPS